jgi:hypothetical protein
MKLQFGVVHCSWKSPLKNKVILRHDWVDPSIHPSGERIEFAKTNQEERTYSHRVNSPPPISDIANRQIRMVAHINMVSFEVCPAFHLEVHCEMTPSSPIVPTFSMPTTPAEGGAQYNLKTR